MSKAFLYSSVYAAAKSHSMTQVQGNFDKFRPTKCDLFNNCFPFISGLETRTPCHQLFCILLHLKLTFSYSDIIIREHFVDTCISMMHFELFVIKFYDFNSVDNKTHNFMFESAVAYPFTQYYSIFLCSFCNVKLRITLQAPRFTGISSKNCKLRKKFTRKEDEIKNKYSI